MQQKFSVHWITDHIWKTFSHSQSSNFEAEQSSFPPQDLYRW